MQNAEHLIELLRSAGRPPVVAPPEPRSALPQAVALWKAEAERRQAEAEATREAEDAAALQRATTPGPEFEELAKE